MRRRVGWRRLGPGAAWIPEAGVPEVGLHELRHTGLTLYGQAGATLADLMARAGHADVETVMIYQHSSRVRDRELADRMSGA
ncbi:MAG: tyrosine-type recombinase/integrase [Bowdeniella nasicola]|nr:tyrosine-type recombinase/integrase [Bowdeniella nasicola]